MITDKDFLVVTRRAAQAFREMAGIDMDEKTIRALILKSLPNGKLVHSREEAKGLLRIIRARVYSFQNECEIMLVWGRLPDGTPCLSPDRKRQVVFVVSFKSRPESLIPAADLPSLTAHAALLPGS